MNKWSFAGTVLRLRLFTLALFLGFLDVFDSDVLAHLADLLD